MPDIGDESVVMIMQITEHLLLAPAADMMRYCRDAASTVGGSTVEAVKASAAKAKDAIDGHGRAGQVSMKTLVREAEGAELVSIPIEARDLQTVQAQLKAYGVTFAVMQNPMTGALSAHFRAASVDQVATALRGVVRAASLEQQAVAQQKDTDEATVSIGDLTMDKEAFEESYTKASVAEEARFSDHSTTREEWAQIIASHIGRDETSFDFEGETFDFSGLLESGGVKIANREVQNGELAGEPEWAELDGEAYAERDGLIICARDDGTVSITEVDNEGQEHELLADKSPIPTLPLAKSFALALASKLAAEREGEQDRAEAKDVQSTFRDAAERAEERNAAAERAEPNERAVERPAPAR